MPCKGLLLTPLLPTSSCNSKQQLLNSLILSLTAALRPASPSPLASRERQGQHEAGRTLRLERLEPI